MFSCASRLPSLKLDPSLPGTGRHGSRGSKSLKTQVTAGRSKTPMSHAASLARAEALRSTSRHPALQAQGMAL
eukprot:6386470-Prymnesium_polylepis.1